MAILLLIRPGRRCSASEKVMSDKVGGLFSRLSLSDKLTALGAATAALALLVTAAAMLVYDYTSQRAVLVRDTAMLAEVVGANSTAALAFADARVASETLAAVAANPHIVSAAVHERNGRVLALYQRPDSPRGTRGPLDLVGPKPIDVPWHLFEREYLVVVRPIRLGDATVGAVAIASDRGELRERTVAVMKVLGGVLVVCLLLSLGISSRLQRLISGPLLELTAITRVVTKERRYDVRARHLVNDEVGELIDGFNEMLVEIQRRDVQLLGTSRSSRRRSRRAPRAANAQQRADRRARQGDGSQPGQERVPREHEPRDPHADERHHRHDRARARHLAVDASSASTWTRSSRRPTRCWRSSTTSSTSPRSSRASSSSNRFPSPSRPVVAEVLKPLAVRAHQKGSS